jgi:hypothetical protein
LFNGLNVQGIELDPFASEDMIDEDKNEQDFIFQSEKCYK